MLVDVNNPQTRKDCRCTQKVALQNKVERLQYRVEWTYQLVYIIIEAREQQHKLATKIHTRVPKQNSTQTVSLC